MKVNDNLSFLLTLRCKRYCCDIFSDKERRSVIIIKLVTPVPRQWPIEGIFLSRKRNNEMPDNVVATNSVKIGGTTGSVRYSLERIVTEPCRTSDQALLSASKEREILLERQGESFRIKDKNNQQSAQRISRTKRVETKPHKSQMEWTAIPKGRGS